MLVVPQKLRRGVQTAPPLLLLLRKWIRSSRLCDVTQPPWERILTLHFDGEVGRCQLVAELIGHYSNVILVGPDGRVLEAAKHVGPDRNRRRVTLPAHPYQPPPQPPGRQAPTSVTVQEWVGILSATEADTPLHRVLTSRLLGVSPTAAREVATRITGNPDARAGSASAHRVAHALAALFAPVQDGNWAPHVATDALGRVIAFAPYKLRQYEHTRPVSQISDAMGLYFRERLTSDTYAAARQRVGRLVDDALSRVQHALEQVRTQQVDQEDIDALREAGELLLTYQNRIHPGADHVTLPGYDGQPRRIDLDPQLSPVENAQASFKRYRKAARAAREIPRRIRTLEADLAYLEQLNADLVLAESRPEIDAVHQALDEAGWISQKPRQSSSGMVEGPRRFSIGGFPVFVGRNASQNDQVTFERAGPRDLWLHARGLPGAHVIVKTSGGHVPDAVVNEAARLAAHYSSAHGSNQVDVDVTEQRFVKRVARGRPGLVTYRNERTLLVRPGEEEPR
jgi:predicted ribosome quality control (RQC) complex YloA/Tae2 family protein